MDLKQLINRFTPILYAPSQYTQFNHAYFSIHSNIGHDFIKHSLHKELMDESYVSLAVNWCYCTNLFIGLHTESSMPTPEHHWGPGFSAQGKACSLIGIVRASPELGAVMEDRDVSEWWNNGYASEVANVCLYE